MVHAKWHTSRGRMGMKDPPCKPGGGAPGVARRCEHARQSWWGRSDVKGQDQNSEEAEEKCAWGALHEVVHTASHLLLSVLRALHVRWHSCLPADQSRTLSLSMAQRLLGSQQLAGRTQQPRQHA